MNAEPQPQTTFIRFRNMLNELERWEREIKLALRHGHDTHTFDDLVVMIASNQVHFYSWEDAFIIAELVTYPQAKIYHCFLAGGSMEGVIAQIGSMRDVARLLGCKHLSMAGREGWKKPLMERGWKPVCVTMYSEEISPA